MKRYRLYSLKAYGHYSGGMAIVAANNENEATAMAVEQLGRNSYRVRYDQPYEVSKLNAFSGAKGIVDHYETGE